MKEFSPLSSSSLGRRRRRRKTSFLFPGGDRRKEKNLKKGGWKKSCCCCPICEREKSFIMLQLLSSQQKCEFDPENWAFYGGNRDHCRVRIGKRPLLPSWSASCTAEHAVSYERKFFLFCLLSPFPSSLHNCTRGILISWEERERKKGFIGERERKVLDSAIIKK